MKKLILFVAFLLVLIFSGIFLFKSGMLFVDGVKNLSGKQNIAAGFAFAELATKYPYSPFMGVARLAAVLKDPQYLNYMDLVLQAKPRKDIFQPFMGCTPAFYDPFFFAAIGYFLLMTFLGLAQRYWAGSSGVSIPTLFRRDTFACIVAVFYILWVRGTMSPDSAVSGFLAGINKWLVEPFGITVVTVGFSAFMILVNLIVTLIALIGFFGKPKLTEK